MIHHVSLGADDIARAQQFYDPLMRLVGFRRIKLDSWGVQYGTGDILFSLLRPDDGGAATAGNGVHVAFAAGDRAIVDQFHAQALQLGGIDGGRPGIRPDYDAHYYACFVADPFGNKIEVVTFAAG